MKLDLKERMQLNSLKRNKSANSYGDDRQREQSKKKLTRADHKYRGKGYEYLFWWHLLN